MNAWRTERFLMGMEPINLFYMMVRRDLQDETPKNISTRIFRFFWRDRLDFFRFSENLVTVFLSYERNAVTFVCGKPITHVERA